MTARLHAVPTTPPRAVLYLRQSTFREESISLTLQETAGRDYCARMGYTVIAVEADPGVSGRTWKRPAVQRVMGMIEAGDAEIVVLWRWSRLSRSRKDWALAADKIEVAGGRIESATEPNDVTAAGRFARGVMTELAAFESERIGEQWKEVHGNRVDRGLAPGRLPWGWIHEDGSAAPDPAAASAIPRLYELYLGGAGWRALSDWLEANGYKTFYGKTKWSFGSIKSILDSPFHCGFIPYHGELRPGAHSALVSKETWERYCALRDRRATERVGRHKYLLSGILHCACGRPMFGFGSHREGHGKPYFGYRCNSVGDGQRSDHGASHVTARAVDPAFLTWLRSYATGTYKAPSVPDDSEFESNRLAREIAAIDQQVLTLTLQFGEAKIPERAYTAAVAHHEERRATLAATLAATERKFRLRPTNPRGSARSLLDLWEVAPVDTKRASIRDVAESVTMHFDAPRRLVIVPFDEPPVTIEL